MTAADISGAKGDSGTAVPARLGTLILAARVGTVADSVGGARRALSTFGTTFSTGVTAFNTGATTGVATSRGGKGFSVVNIAVGVDAVSRIELVTGTIPKDS